jgi:RHS repeat-associated protein
VAFLAETIGAFRLSIKAHPTQARSERFDYDPSTYHLIRSQNHYDRYSRNNRGFVASIDQNKYQWNGDYLSEANSMRIYYDGEDQWIASCPKSKNPAQNQNDCVIRHADDLYEVGGELIALIRLDQMPILAFTQGQFYPVVTDYMGSIRGMLHPNQPTLLWERHFGPWGEKQASVQNQEAHLSLRYQKLDPRKIEQKTLWSYAGLTEIPGIQTKPGLPLYWSKTRVYSPAIREWMSADPLVKWNAKQLLKNPGNWHAVRYAANRPMEFVDPSGEAAGDVWLYTSNSFLGRIVQEASYIADGFRETRYSHAGIEISRSRLYTADGKVAHAIQDKSQAVYFGGPRKIDIYRHRNSGQFNVESATNFAEGEVFRTSKDDKPNRSFRDKWGRPYLLGGHCATATENGIDTGGLTKGDYGKLTTPQDFASDENFEHVGTYNTEKSQSEIVETRDE